MTSVRFTQHSLAVSELSPEAAEECRRSVSRSSTRSSPDASSPGVVRFHYEVGVVEPKSGALHLIQVCCQVCVEGRGCCKASVCCDAVCCQLQLPNAPPESKSLVAAADEEDDGPASREIELPRTVAASAASHAGLASYPITARELMAHVAKCCDLCLDGKSGACCKKDCCAVSCCLVNVEVMDGPTFVSAYNKLGSSPAASKPVATCGTKKGACCPVTVIKPANSPLEVKKPCGEGACCTKDQKAKSPRASVVSPSHSHHADEAHCADKASSVFSLNERWPLQKGCCETSPAVIKACESKKVAGAGIEKRNNVQPVDVSHV